MCVKLKKTMLVGFMAGWMLWGGVAELGSAAE